MIGSPCRLGIPVALASLLLTAGCVAQARPFKALVAQALPDPQTAIPALPESELLRNRGGGVVLDL